MNEVKPHLSYERQINKLHEKGCIIDDDSFCRDVLVNIGYYRLSAYFLPFKSFDGTYMDNLSFERVYRVYEFDRKLRNLLFSAIEVIEVSLRTRLAHYVRIMADFILEFSLQCLPDFKSPKQQNEDSGVQYFL